MKQKDDYLRDLIAEEAAERYVNARGNGAAKNDDLFAWLRRSPEHVAAYLRVAGVAEDVASAVKQFDVPLEELDVEACKPGNVIELADQDLRGRELASLPRPNSVRRRPVVASAAALIAVIGVAMGLTLTSSSTGQEFATVRGEDRTWRLADNTMVHLNSDTEIRVAFDQNSRLVEIDRGQVFFEVAKDPRRPFRVRAGNTILQDIGTSFDVFRKNTGTVVTVVEGQVAIWKTDQLAATLGASAPVRLQGQPLTDLHAGQQATISPNGTVRAADAPSVRRATAWTKQEIIFEEEPVTDVVVEFNRYNAVQIRVDDPQVAKLAISGVFHTYDMESFVAFLNSLPGIEATREADTVVVNRRHGPSRG